MIEVGDSDIAETEEESVIFTRAKENSQPTTTGKPQSNLSSINGCATSSAEEGKEKTPTEAMGE